MLGQRSTAHGFMTEDNLNLFKNNVKLYNYKYKIFTVQTRKNTSPVSARSDPKTATALNANR